MSDASEVVSATCVADAALRAYLVAQAYRYFPKNTVHIVVVDPGVGTARRTRGGPTVGTGRTRTGPGYRERPVPHVRAGRLSSKMGVVVGWFVPPARRR